MVSTASAVPEHVFGHSLDAKDGGDYTWQWNRTWSAIRKNIAGTTGWAHMLQSTNADHPTGGTCRIHLCAQNPCASNWTASKYGHAGPPLHLQEGHTPMSSAVAGLAPVELAPSGQLPPVESAPAEELALEEPEAAVEEPKAKVEEPEPEAAVAEIPAPATPPPRCFRQPQQRRQHF